jgi:putative redox protein
MRETTVATAEGKYRQTISIGPHRLPADEGTEVGGGDAGPAPHEFLLAALGACTSMTLKMYADRKQWALKHVEVKLDGAHEGGVFRIQRHIRLEGDLDAEQRARLIEIANKCPVHKTLTGTIAILTEERA